MKQMILIACVLLFVACSKNIDKGDLHKRTSKNLIGFFDEHAYDPQLKTYFSELDNNGNLTSRKIYNVALSRMIYGLAYTSKDFPENLQKAKDAATFQLNNLIGKDSVGEYFISYVENDKKDQSNYLDIWQQAYGLCGLSELYRATHEDKLLKRIHVLHEAFVRRFRDTISGGFYGNYEIGKGQIAGSKSLQSLMYPITAYTANLWHADSLHRTIYEPMMKENLNILYQSGWNERTGWVNVKFNDTWKVCESEPVTKPCFMVSPGHNFQLAALFLRASAWPFIAESDRKAYRLSGKKILRTTLFRKPIFKEKGGFVRELNPLNDSITDTRSSWWQHSEALIALSLAEDEFQGELLKLHDFFFSHFQDFESGGEFFFLDENNQPIRTEQKGSIGKSAYHTIEMIRFLETEPAWKE